MEHARPALILDRRPLYPEVVAVNVPRGFAAKLRDRAAAEGTSVAALARQAFDQLLASPSNSISGAR